MMTDKALEETLARLPPFYPPEMRRRLAELILAKQAEDAAKGGR
jgi:hypothetical protein